MIKLQDVVLKAMAKKLSWVAAAEIAGMSVGNMQRMRQRYVEHGYNGLFDQRRGKRSIHRIEWRRPNGYWRCIGRSTATGN
jgi:transposase